ISLLGFPQQTVNTVPDAVYRQIGKNPQKDRIGPVNASTESFPVFNPAIVFTPVTRWTELVVNHSMRRIADFETCFADAYRILSVLAEPRGSRPGSGVKLPHFIKHFSFKKHFVSGEPAVSTLFPAVVDDRDVIFTQPLGISSLAIDIYPRENTSLHGIERRHAVRLRMLDQTLRVDDHIVVDNQNDFPLRGPQAAVQSVRLAPSLLQENSQRKLCAFSCCLS